jgi:hypothetical protein
VADENFGLQVIDISNPASPTLLGTYNTPGYALGVTVSGDYAFVADQSSGLQVIDISNPASPTLLGNYDTPGSARGVTVSGDYAFVADRSSGLQVVDISNPANPTLLGSYDTPGNAEGVTVSGDHVFVADASSGLLVIDISEAASPTLTCNYNTPGTARGVAVSGDQTFVADGDSGLQGIQTSERLNPTLLGSYNTQGFAFAQSVVVSGDNAFVAVWRSGLQVIDISNPAGPALLGNYDTPGYAYGVAVSGDYAFVADQSSGLQVIDISNPASPALLGNYDTPDYAYGVAVSGDYAFVADNYSGLQVIDISNPASPALLGTYDTPGNALGVAVSGDYAFVADRSFGLQVIDISNPAGPTLLGTCYTPGWAEGVAVSGDYAFVADEYFLNVIDISDPASPTLLGSCDTPGDAVGVTVSGDYAFVADAESGLTVIDITDPGSPTLLGNYNTPGIAFDVAVSGDCAFVADDDIGLQVIHVFQSEVITDNNAARSLSLDASNGTICRARLTSTQTDSVNWELSADGGVHWQGIVPDGNWNQMAVLGTDLLWRSTHTWAAPGVNPGATQIEIDWFIAEASVYSIVDVPDDQGRSVSLSFTRSGYDFLDETAFPVVGYAIYRRLDDPLLMQQVINQPAVSRDEVLDFPQLASFAPDRVRRLADRTFVVGGSSSAAGTLPPGIWEGVGWVLPTQNDTYTARVNTLVDSTAGGTGWTAFVTAVHTSTPSVWYVSEPDSGYSLDNIAPAVPEGFAVAYNTGSGNHLSWDPCPDADFQYFKVYRSNDPDFVPAPTDLVYTTTGASWNDPEYDGWNVYYKVTALDFVGNESDPASAGTVTAVAGPVIPKTFGLYPNVPNPFNPTTVIRYDVPPSGGAVTLRIYDVSGKLVRTLVDGPQTAGQKTAAWNGRDNRGHSVASGVYFYQLQAPGYEKTLKMVLVQ